MILRQEIYPCPILLFRSNIILYYKCPEKTQAFVIYVWKLEVFVKNYFSSLSALNKESQVKIIIKMIRRAAATEITCNGFSPLAIRRLTVKINWCTPHKILLLFGGLPSPFVVSIERTKVPEFTELKKVYSKTNATTQIICSQWISLYYYKQAHFWSCDNFLKCFD